MSETTAQCLTRLHGSIALEADAQIIDVRSKAIESIASKVTTPQAVTIAAAAAGVFTDVTKFQWFLGHISDLDPSFAPVAVDKAVSATTSALTHRLLAGNDAKSTAAALTVLSARMSAASAGSAIDDRLAAAAQQRLWAIQQTPMPEVRYPPAAASFTAEQLVAVQTPMSQNSAATAFEPLKVILDALSKADVAQGKATLEALRVLTVRQIILQEDSQMQWWVVGKASHDLLRPFIELAPFEAAARSAKELAGLISAHRPAGPFAAPALLERVLESTQKARAAAVPFSKAITTMSLDTRRAIFVNKPSTSVVPGAFPIMLGAEYSIESEDAPDWQPRFARTAHVGAATEITPLELAKQLLREILLWKLLAA